ncbi:hypothetical protein [Pontibacillus sp. HMF3514]|uniref:hypothetical protein n=1 Tax=Pontibacillus sp. HMF3514 TaxID=2692425 RepID=UPI0013200A3D|nr:hypothetical protein [Pontibacillus sp. HMF3514]QHE53727.1 hypothetical protein GS400_17650 [Pontibacillus sp. HMF3514]
MLKDWSHVVVIYNSIENNSLKLDNNYLFSKILVFFFVFTIVFAPSIGGYDTRYFYIFLWFFIALIKNKGNPIRIYKLDLIFLSGPIFIGGYALLIIAFTNSYDYFEVLRSFRAAIMYFIIYFFIYSWNISGRIFIKVIENILLIHAITILIAIVFPEFEAIIQFISSFEKVNLPLRSTGLVSSYEGAGFLCLTGIILNSFNVYYKNKKLLNYKSFIFIISVLFTSRTSITVLCILILIMFVYAVISGKVKSSLNVLKYVAPLAVISLSFLILTTNIGSEYRNEIYKYLPKLYYFFEYFDDSYTDYGKHTRAVERHIEIGDDINTINLVFGSGTRIESKDPGYIKIIYSTGIIGVIISLYIYLKSIINLRFLTKSYNYKGDLYSVLYSWVIFITLIYELKIPFIFSSVFFELTCILYLSILNEVRLRREVFIH